MQYNAMQYNAMQRTKLLLLARPPSVNASPPKLTVISRVQVRLDTRHTY